MNNSATSIRLAGTIVGAGRDWRGLRDDVRKERLVRVRHGAYANELEQELEALHLQLIEATLPRLAPQAALSHSSAAVLHGLPLWEGELERVHITRERRSGGRRHPQLWVHVGPLEAEDLTVIDGLLVTNLARTVADLGRTLPVGRAVATADAALHLGLERQLLEAETASAERRHGARQLRFVARFADHRAESPGESFSRLLIHDVRLPPPEPQYKVIVPATGEIIAYCDFGWEEYRTVGEFDGRAKYGRLLKPGQDPGDVVYGEKVREDRIRTLAHEMARWTQVDLSRPRLFKQRLEQAFERGRRLH